MQVRIRTVQVEHARLTTGILTGVCRMSMMKKETRSGHDLEAMKSRRSGWLHGEKAGLVSREFASIYSD